MDPLPLFISHYHRFPQLHSESQNGSLSIKASHTSNLCAFSPELYIWTKKPAHLWSDMHSEFKDVLILSAHVVTKKCTLHHVMHRCA